MGRSRAAGGATLAGLFFLLSIGARDAASKPPGDAGAGGASAVSLIVAAQGAADDKGDELLGAALSLLEGEPPPRGVPVELARVTLDARIGPEAHTCSLDTPSPDRAAARARQVSLADRLVALAEGDFGAGAPETAPYLEELLRVVPVVRWADVMGRLLVAQAKNPKTHGADLRAILDTREGALEACDYSEADAAHARLQTLVERDFGGASALAMHALRVWLRAGYLGRPLAPVYERLLTLAEKHPEDADEELDDIETFASPSPNDAIDALDSFGISTSRDDVTPSDAVALLQRVVTLRSGGPAARLVRVLDALAAQLDASGRHADADAVDGRANALVATTADAEAVAKRDLENGVAWIARHRPDRGDVLLAAFEEAASKVKDREALAEDALRLASRTLLTALGEIERAEQVARVAQRLVPPSAKARAFYKDLTVLYLSAGDHDASEAAYAQWSSLLDPGEAANGELDLLGGSALVRALSGDFAGAEDTLSRALPLAATAGPRTEAMMLGQLGAVVARRDAGRAGPLVSRMLALETRSPEAVDGAVGFASALATLGRADDARALLERASTGGSQRAWEALGLFREARGEWPQAIAAMQKAVAAVTVRDTSGLPPPPPLPVPAPPDMPSPPPEAPAPDDTTGPAPPPAPGGSGRGSDDAPMLASPQVQAELARVLARAGKVDEARAAAEPVRRLLGTEEMDTSPIVYGSMYVALGETSTADDLLSNALAKLGRYADWTFSNPDMLAAWGAEAYVLGGAPAGGIPWMDRGQAGVDRLLASTAATAGERQNEALGQLAAVLPGAVSFHLAAARESPAAARLALRSLLRAKGRALDTASQSTAALRAHLAPDDRGLLDALAAKRVEISRASARDDDPAAVADLQAEADRLETTLATKSAAYRAAAGLTTVEEVAARIPQGSALVEFARVDVPTAWRSFSSPDSATFGVFARGVPHYAAYVLSPRGAVSFVDLGVASQVDALATTLRDALSSPDRDPLPAARAFDEAVMRKVRPLLGDATHLIVSPDGALAFVPLAALVDETGEYLAGRYSFTYVTSGRDLLRMQARAAPREGPTVFAAPDYGRYAGARSGTLLGHIVFSPLAATSAEGQEVAASLHATLLTGSRASEASLRSVHGPSVLHVATHGFFLSRDGAAAALSGSRAFVLDSHGRGASLGVPQNALLRAGLALADANVTDDGMMTALEASSLDLFGTKLVVLSACETGLGDVSDSEGVIGMRRAFELAGAESLVMTLWKVDDDATRAFMERYYAALAAGAGRTEALVTAQAAERAAYPHPYYWAAFVPIGDWRTLAGGETTPAVSASAAALFKVPPPRACGCRAVGGGASQEGVGASVLAAALALAGLGRRRTRPAQEEPED